MNEITTLHSYLDRALFGEEKVTSLGSHMESEHWEDHIFLGQNRETTELPFIEIITSREESEVEKTEKVFEDLIEELVEYEYDIGKHAPHLEKNLPESTPCFCGAFDESNAEENKHKQEEEHFSDKKLKNQLLELANIIEQFPLATGKNTPLILSLLENVTKDLEDLKKLLYENK